MSDAITGEPLIPTMTELTEEIVSRALEMGVEEFKIALIDGKFISPSLYRNLLDEERDFAENWQTMQYLQVRLKNMPFSRSMKGYVQMIQVPLK